MKNAMPVQESHGCLQVLQSKASRECRPAVLCQPGNHGDEGQLWMYLGQHIARGCQWVGLAIKDQGHIWLARKAAIGKGVDASAVVKLGSWNLLHRDNQS